MLNLLANIGKTFLILIGIAVVTLVVIVGIAITQTSNDSAQSMQVATYKEYGLKPTALKLSEDYNFVKEHGGSWMERCVKAGFVREAMSQLHDDELYQGWKKIEKRDCRKAGL